MQINENLTYREIINILEGIKAQYNEILCSFSLYQLKQRNDFVRNFKNQIYSLKFEMWKRDKIWEYLNGYEFLFVLKRLI